MAFWPPTKRARTKRGRRLERIEDRLTEIESRLIALTSPRTVEERPKPVDAKIPQPAQEV